MPTTGPYETGVRVNPTGNGLDDLLNYLRPAHPVTLPRTLVDHRAYRSWLNVHVMRMPNAASGFPGRAPICSLAEYLRMAHASRDGVWVWPDKIVIGSIRYPTPAWVKALIQAESAIKFDRPQTETYREALSRLDDVLLTLE